MTSNRDDLATLIYEQAIEFGRSPNDVADRIITAGWRPPARVIETVEELAALPAGSIVHRNDLMGGSYAFQRYDDEPGWMPTSWESEPIDTADVPLPVTVLFEPEEGE